MKNKKIKKIFSASLVVKHQNALPERVIKTPPVSFERKLIYA